MESYLDTKEFEEGVAKVGPDSKFYYRSKFDPVWSSQLKEEDSERKAVMGWNLSDC